MPSWDDHAAYVTNTDRKFWGLIETDEIGDEPLVIGSIYLSAANEIGIAVTKLHQGNGYATQAILELMKMYPEETFLANVAPLNAASHMLFKGLGFKPIQLTYKLRKA